MGSSEASNSARPSTFDVFSFGVVSSSTLYTINGEFPEPEGYAEFDGEHYMTGGEATNSSIVLARLGVRVKLDGNWLGDDEAGQRTRALLEGYEIDTSRLPLKAGHSTVREVVFAAPGTRTIFGTYVRMHEESGWNTPTEGDILQAKVLCLDPFFADASARAASIAFKAGIPAITVDCKYDDPLVMHTAAVVIAESYLQSNYPGEPLEKLFQRYQQAAPGLVVFTFGGKETWFARPGAPIERCPSFPVDAVDTAGAGDSFRAGIVYGFLNDWDDAKMIEFSAALAAMVCTRSPGVLDSPGYDEVEAFMLQAARA